MELRRSCTEQLTCSLFIQSPLLWCLREARSKLEQAQRDATDTCVDVLIKPESLHIPSWYGDVSVCSAIFKRGRGGKGWHIDREDGKHNAPALSSTLQGVALHRDPRTAAHNVVELAPLNSQAKLKLSSVTQVVGDLLILEKYRGHRLTCDKWNAPLDQPSGWFVNVGVSCRQISKRKTYNCSVPSCWINNHKPKWPQKSSK